MHSSPDLSSRVKSLFIGGLGGLAASTVASEPSLDDDAAVSYFPPPQVLHYGMEGGWRMPKGLLLLLLPPPPPTLRSIVRKGSYCSSGPTERAHQCARAIGEEKGAKDDLRNMDINHVSV